MVRSKSFGSDNAPRQFHCEPPTPHKPASHAFVQTLRMRDGNRELGRATWTAADPSDGVVQILEIWIDPSVRRSGNGKRLLLALIEQARAFHQLRKQNLRRLWIGVGHKTQVVGRSFLSSTGFHHIGSASGLLEDQDLMVYVKSLD